MLPISTLEENFERSQRRLKLERSLRNLEQYSSQRLVFDENGECVVEDVECNDDSGSIGDSSATGRTRFLCCAKVKRQDQVMSTVQLRDEKDDNSEKSWISCSSILCRSRQRTEKEGCFQEDKQTHKLVRRLVFAGLLTAVLLGASFGAFVLLYPNKGHEDKNEIPQRDPSMKNPSESSAELTGHTTSEGDVFMNDEERQDIILEIITQSGLSSEEDLKASGTAPNQALQWLLGHSERELPLAGQTRDARKVERRVTLERYAVAVLWYASSQTSGGTKNAAAENWMASARSAPSLPIEASVTGWKTSNGWMSTSISVCQWHGIICGPPHALVSRIFSAHRGANSAPYVETVSELRLNDNDLEGRIPPELSALKDLKVLDMSGNNLFGNIPTSLGQLRQLEILNVQDNALTGAMPREVCSLTENVSDDEDADYMSGGMRGTVVTAAGSSSTSWSLGKLLDVSADCGPENQPRISCSCCSSC